MKTLKLALVAILFSIALPLSFAHAQSAPADPYAAFYPVATNGSTASDFNFAIGSNPYLYVDLPTTNPEYITISSGLNSSTLTNTYNLEVSSPTAQTWIPLQNYVTSPGIWDITGTTLVPGGVAGAGSVTSYGGVTQLAYGSNFHINSAPEPMGTVLFLLGGAIMAIFLVRRKKVLAV